MFWCLLPALGVLNASPTGELRGEARYPACMPPRITVCAELVSGGPLICAATDEQGRYRLTVPAGTYYVFAKAEEFLLERAYFTRAVLCGLDVECKDHTRIPVEVGAGRILTGVDPADWYERATDSVPWPPRV